MYIYFFILLQIYIILEAFLSVDQQKEFVI